jgi:hypothetical protein
MKWCGFNLAAAALDNVTDDAEAVVHGLCWKFGTNGTTCHARASSARNMRSKAAIGTRMRRPIWIVGNSPDLAAAYA